MNKEAIKQTKVIYSGKFQQLTDFKEQNYSSKPFFSRLKDKIQKSK